MRLIAMAGTVVLALGLVSCVEEQAGHDMSQHMTSAGSMPLFDNLGVHSHPITTHAPEAQAYFDQGYRLLFNFNHAGAIASFQEALKRDPSCAMCWWGIGFAHGPNINMPMMPDAVAPAVHAVEMAQQLAPGASAKEQGYIAALAKRYSSDPKAERAALDRAFMEAMRALAKRHPKDLDAQVLYAEALMDTSPWDYWKADRRTPKAGYENLVPTIEAVLKRAPRHPGAMHLYIHAVEASLTPQRAEKYADALGPMLPGAGHLVHMPTHIYNRIGRYDDGVVWNQKAARADEAYIAATGDRGMYAAMYYVHNLHFVWTAATNDGRSALALEYAQNVVDKVQSQMARQLPSVEAFVPTKLYAQLRFGKWNDVLAADKPDAALHYATAMWHYARARALAKTGKLVEAGNESAMIASSFSADDATNFQNFGVPGEDMVRIAGHIARADIASAKGDWADAVNELKAAVTAQDHLSYTEPPWWDFPTRGFLGAALIQAGRASEAVDVYREDLKEWPKNGWSLYGLSVALRKAGRSREALAAEAAYKKAWVRADVTLRESRF